MSHIVLYTSGHGFGHAVRDAELLAALRRLAPDLALQVRTPAPRWIFPSDVDVVPRTVDAGVAQPDSLRVEPRETLARYAALVSDEARLIEAEVAELIRGDARVVLADIPSLAFAIAERAGVPGIGVANFSWDWIYEPYARQAPAFAWVLGHLRAQYRRADLLLRLPLHAGLSSFPVVQDVPLIARVSREDPGATRRRLGLPLEAPVVLLSFGGFAFNGLDAKRLAEMDEFVFVTTSPTGAPRRDGNLVTLPRDGFPYVDLLAACDAVVAKPGYGIVADCLANRVPMLYVTRGRFREEPTLSRGIERLGRAARISRADLRRWNLRPHLERLLALDKPWCQVRLDGAETAARHILSKL